ncbi:MAG: N-acyl-D-amino-acid deacylase [Actinomycetota bacterium]|jgi:N-acyl-D-aspartate/D-glutamate deacylase|nr:N-acyl-D-amino-acid deacylase [Actinomycetota bacterium]
MHDLVIRDAVIVDGTGAPKTAGDVAIDDTRISEVGEVTGKGRREIDADGLILAPGWVDIHTHYDGQATWDPDVTPSSWHGVTTVVMGNCGVGFAPVRPDGQEFLIELMEGVEDIPGTALAEGIDWTWESFDQYLDALDATRRVLDVAAQVPHAAVRAYVMGERAHEDATPDEVAAMAVIVEKAISAGAAGFTTSRTILHRSRHGLVPGTTAPLDELLAMADALAGAGHGVFQLVSDQAGSDEEQVWLTEIAKRTGGVVTYSLAQTPFAPEAYKSALANAQALQRAGLQIIPQVSCRPTGMLFGLQSSLHPFITHPTYRALSQLPLAERVRQLSTAEVRQRLLTEEAETGSAVARVLMSRWDQIFPLGDPPDYEPAPETSVAATAGREGRRPEEVVLDWLLEREGEALLFAPLASYADGDHEALRVMMTDPGTVLGLSDGGAHCGLICDVSMPTSLLTHWVRDRQRGPRLPIEQAVKLQTSQTATAYGFDDRGTVAVGKRADLNLIDLDGMVLHAPEMVFDLPAGGRRLVQRVDGYKATVVAGEITMEEGEPTGARPGRLVRFGQI